MLSATLLAMVPWMQISKAVADKVSVQPGALATAVAAGVGIHFLFLAFNMTAVRALKLGGGDNPAGMLLEGIQNLYQTVIEGLAFYSLHFHCDSFVGLQS